MQRIAATIVLALVLVMPTIAAAQNPRHFHLNGQNIVEVKPSPVRVYTWVQRNGKWLEAFHSIVNPSGASVKFFYRTEMSAPGVTTKEYKTPGPNRTNTVEGNNYIYWTDRWAYPSWAAEIPNGALIQVTLELLNPRSEGRPLGHAEATTPNTLYSVSYGSETALTPLNAIPKAAQAEFQKWLTKR